MVDLVVSRLEMRPTISRLLRMLMRQPAAPAQSQQLVPVLTE